MNAPLPADERVIKPIDEKALQVNRWLTECLDKVRAKMLEAGYPVDGYDISLIFKDGQIEVKVTR
jgi:hypothetical protein